MATTDKNGFYEMRELFDGVEEVSTSMDGYETVKSNVSIKGIHGLISRSSGADRARASLRFLSISVLAEAPSHREKDILLGVSVPRLGVS